MAKVLPIKPPSEGGITKPTEGVELDLGDGVKRELRYSIRSLKMLKEKGFILGHWDDTDIPVLIWIGLHDDAGKPPEDVAIEDIERLGASWRPYLGAAFVLAYTGSMPPPREPLPEEKKDPSTVN